MDIVKFSLAAARVNAGFSQKEAAERLGISNKTLCSWENYQSYPAADKVQMICDLYAIPYDQINFAQKSA